MNMATKDDPEEGQSKPVGWIASSRKELKGFPEGVRYTVGQALRYAQNGKKHPDAKPLKGFHGGSVLEVVADDDGNTHRVVYTVKFAGIVYVLHAFQKKSKRGNKTPPQEIEKVKARLKEAEKAYAEWVKKRDWEDQNY